MAAVVISSGSSRSARTTSDSRPWRSGQVTWGRGGDGGDVMCAGGGIGVYVCVCARGWVKRSCLGVVQSCLPNSRSHATAIVFPQ
jgi:hypothetical protein